MSDMPVEKKFAVLQEITRALHFAWREAVVRKCPDVDPAEVVREMWEITGQETGAAYLKRLDPEGDVARQVAESIVWSSRCMGEDCRLEPGEADGEWLVVHEACPWQTWHEKRGLLSEDRPACDAWFAQTIRAVNEGLGTKLAFETLSALPDGAPRCARRIRVEPR